MFRVPDLQRILDLTKPGYERLKAEFFADGPTSAPPSLDISVTSPVTGAMVPDPSAAKADNSKTLVILSVLLSLVLSFLLSFGAARLSWCYNMYLGNPTGISIFYGFLAWVFAGFYYPFYAWFLNPVCSFKKPAPLMGGRRR